MLDTFSLPAYQTALAIYDKHAIEALLDTKVDLHARDPFFGNAIQCAVALLNVYGIKGTLEKGAAMDPEGSGWEELISTVEKGSYLVEGETAGKIAAARLRIGQKFFGRQNHSEDLEDRLKGFCHAIYDAQIWSHHLHVSWEKLRVWEGQKEQSDNSWWYEKRDYEREYRLDERIG